MPSSETNGNFARYWPWALAAVVVLSVLVRGALLFRRPSRPDDPDNYLPLARSLGEGKGLVFNGRPTAYRPPLYPIVLAPLVQGSETEIVRRIGALHILLGAATVMLTAATARRWGLSHVRALIAATVVACDPVLAAQASSVMTETLGAFLVALTLWSLTWPGLRGVILGGISFGVSSLCRPSLLPGAALTAFGICWIGPGTRRARFGHALILVLATGLTLAPWAIRNLRILGEPVWTTTHGGYTLFLANNPFYYDEVLHGPPGAVWTGPTQLQWVDSVYAAGVGATEPEGDRRLQRMALDVIAKRPVDFVRATLARLGRFWSVAPAAAVYPKAFRLATAVWTIPLWCAFVVGLVSRAQWAWPRAAAPLVILGLTCVHAFYWTDLRMRAPIVPAIALIAAGASLPRRPPRPDGGPPAPCSVSETSPIIGQT